MEGQTMRPLQGLRILDLTRVLAGPYCTLVLADLGAEVVKVEVPGVGDDARHFGPFLGGESAYFMSLNRNKKSVTLNLKEGRGRELLLGLAAKSDVLVENYRPGTLEKLGLGYDRLIEANPRLVYAAVSGFGDTGPYRLKPAYDLVVQGMGGVMSITGQPGGAPTRVGASVGDITAGLFAAIGVLGALRARDRTGKGQKVDVSMLDCQVAILENAIARYHATGDVPGPIGNRHPSITPFSSVSAADGYLIIAIGNDLLWEKFCRLVDREDLLAEDAFRTNQRRTEHWDRLEPVLREVFGKRPVAEWLELLEGAGIPCGPINRIDQVVQDPQVQAREMIVQTVHPAAGPFRTAGSPIKVPSAGAAGAPRPSPLLGQHSAEVFADLLGLGEEELARLGRDGVI